MIKKNAITVQSLTSLMLGLSMFLLAKPFFVWGRTWVYVLPVAGLVFFGIFCLAGRFNSRLLVGIAASWVCFFLVWLPFREFDSFSLFLFVVFVPFSIVFFLSRKVVDAAIDVYVDLMILVAACSIVSMLAWAVSLPFPTIVIDNEARSDIFYLYYLSLILDSQTFGAAAITITRAVGWFQEPGHFAIYLSVALVFCLERQKRWQTIILSFALMLTFSTTAYILMVVIFTVASGRYKNILWFSLIAVFCWLIYYFVPPVTDLFNELFVEKLFGSSGAGFNAIETLEARTKGAAFGVWPDFDEYFLGIGLGYFDYMGLVLSDYRRLIIGSGYLSFFALSLFFLYMLFVAIRAKDRISINIVLLFFIAMTHRSWFFHQGFMWVLVGVVFVRLCWPASEGKFFSSSLLIK